jgi:putative DNA primase/helicase
VTTAFEDDLWDGFIATEAPVEPAGGDLNGAPNTMGACRRTWDDIGNADRLVDHAGHRIRWAIDAEKWAVWTDGNHWAIEGGGTLIVGVAREVLDRMPFAEAPLYDDTPRMSAEGKPLPSLREDFLKFVKRQRFNTKMAAMAAVARSVPSIQVRMDQFDSHPMLFNCRNGIIDMRTGDLQPHDSALLQLSLSNVVYNPDAKAPLWEAFLARVMPEKERRDYLARISGYTLTGDTGEQAIFCHHGGGANGKSVFMRILRALAGTYGQAVPQATLLTKSGDGIPNDVARMIGKRLLITSETGAGKRLDDELVKQLTGGEEISARFMRGEFFDFTPVGKIHLMTNHLPVIGSGHGTARRLQDIGWDVTIPPEEQDKSLADRIIAEELPGVLAWAVRGCLEWRETGLAVPESVRLKTAEHVRSSDPLAQWLEERTDTVAEEVTETRPLFKDYRAWVDESNGRPMTEKSFVDAMDERGFVRDKDGHTRRSVIRGIRLVPRMQQGGGYGL